MSTQTCTVSDVTLSVEVTGPRDGILAVALHGFPDSWHTYDSLREVLHERGFRVATPAMRGFYPSSVSPSGAYGVPSLANDANQIHEQLGGDSRAVLIGHDWGAAAVYPALAAAPERWTRGVAMAVPPLMSMAAAFSQYVQLQHSWYMFYFQQPNAELVVSANDYSFIGDLWRDWSPNLTDPAALENAKAGLRPDGHLSAALGYYRSMFGNGTGVDESHLDTFPAVFSVPPQPVLYIHADDDGCIAGETIGNPLDFLSPESQFVSVPDAGHFMHLERPDYVNTLIADFLGSSPGK